MGGSVKIIPCYQGSKMDRFCALSDTRKRDEKSKDEQYSTDFHRVAPKLMAKKRLANLVEIQLKSVSLTL
jgi:hypothetical protein